MSVLSACQTAGVRLTGVKPTTVFSTTDRFALELSDIANEAASAIVKAHEWQALMTEATIAGNGTTVTLSLPSDFERLPKNARLYSSRSALTPMTKAKDQNQWLEYTIEQSVPVYGVWIILGGKLNVRPVLATGESVRFYYISKNFVIGEKPAFAVDADAFKLPERLLTLSIIWRWRAQKRLEYGEDLANYEMALSEEIANDGGAKTLVIGSPRARVNAEVAFHGTIDG